ncbi:hypothetical protein D778_00467 [Xanthomarina gelatinilytica]|uniref:Uncharacterized protein n=1 Tax=Xanthomarina gelatinilytica TaxID=1137281 RepID=M7MYF3_9FLAO|nr:hypothetical protein [Xanthomarina gelatinilytica]EMQ94514.1 hypothetical protein D778_00467 [Xanthomarina gelatinilytica]
MRPIFLMLIFILFATSSCKQSSDEENNVFEEKIDELENSTKVGSWQQNLITTEPLQIDQLKAKLPKQLAGLPLRSSDSPAAQTVVGTYSVSTNPNHETENITVKILDGAGNYGFGHVNAVHKMISMEVNNKGDNNWAKTLDHQGVRILLKEERVKDIQFSELQYIKQNRYHISLTGRRLDSKKLLQAKTDLEKTNF